MKPTDWAVFTDWEIVALGILTDLHEQNQKTSNPVLVELEPVSGVNSRWAAAVVGLLLFAGTVYEEPKPSHESQQKTSEKQPGWHTWHSIGWK